MISIIKQSFVFSILFILLGVIFYVMTGAASVTALIPAFFGIAMFIGTMIGTKEKLQMHAMHVVVLLALIGFVMTVKGVPGAVTLMSGGEVERPMAALEQAIMSVLCLVFIVLSVRHFISNRRKKSPEVLGG